MLMEKYTWSVQFHHPLHFPQHHHHWHPYEGRMKWRRTAQLIRILKIKRKVLRMMMIKKWLNRTSNRYMRCCSISMSWRIEERIRFWLIRPRTHHDDHWMKNHQQHVPIFPYLSSSLFISFLLSPHHILLHFLEYIKKKFLYSFFSLIKFNIVSIKYQINYYLWRRKSYLIDPPTLVPSSVLLYFGIEPR